MKYLKEVRTALVTALVVFLAMQVLMQIIQPFIPLIVIGVVVLSIGWYVYSRATRL